MTDSLRSCACPVPDRAVISGVSLGLGDRSGSFEPRLVMGAQNPVVERNSADSRQSEALWGSEMRAWVLARPGGAMLARCFASSTAFWRHLLDSLCAPVAPKTSRTSATAPDSSPPRSTPVGVKYSSEPVSGRSRRGDHVSKRINRVGGGTRPITPRATDLGDFLLVA